MLVLVLCSTAFGHMGYETSRYRLASHRSRPAESVSPLGSKSKCADLVISSALWQHIHMDLGICTLAMTCV